MDAYRSQPRPFSVHLEDLPSFAVRTGLVHNVLGIQGVTLGAVKVQMEIQIAEYTPDVDRSHLLEFACWRSAYSVDYDWRKVPRKAQMNIHQMDLSRAFVGYKSAGYFCVGLPFAVAAASPLADGTHHLHFPRSRTQSFLPRSLVSSEGSRDHS